MIVAGTQLQILLTLGAHAQRGLQYLVCVSVCLSVHDYSRTTGYGGGGGGGGGGGAAYE